MKKALFTLFVLLSLGNSQSSIASFDVNEEFLKAARDGKIETITQYIDQISDKCASNSLVYAALNSKWDVVEKLIEKKITVIEKEKAVDAAVTAQNKGKTTIVNKILENRSDIERIEIEAFSNNNN